MISSSTAYADRGISAMSTRSAKIADIARRGLRAARRPRTAPDSLPSAPNAVPPESEAWSCLGPGDSDASGPVALASVGAAAADIDSGCVTDCGAADCVALDCGAAGSAATGSGAVKGALTGGGGGAGCAVIGNNMAPDFP